MAHLVQRPSWCLGQPCSSRGRVLRSRMVWASLLTAPLRPDRAAVRARVLAPAQPVRPGAAYRLRHRKPDLLLRDRRPRRRGLPDADSCARTPASTSRRIGQHVTAGTARRWRAPLSCSWRLLPLPWNPIYAGIGALLAGALTTLLCRPDLTRRSADRRPAGLRHLRRLPARA